MTRKILWILMVVFAILIGLYPGVYFFIERTFGLLQTKPGELLTDTLWNIGFYTHIVLGGLALMIGWMQFSPKIRAANPILHKRIGTVYITAVALSSVAGIYIAMFATGGVVTSLGFVCLGIIWLGTTLKAYTDIRNGMIASHQKMMIYSYAACFSAVTLRIWLPLLIIGFKDFMTAYIIVAWLCWIPNIFIAYLINRQIGVRNRKDQALTS